MIKKVKAVFDSGTLRLLEKIDLPEHRELTVVIFDDDVPAEGILELARVGGSFDFLTGPGEDVYTREDGEPV